MAKRDLVLELWDGQKMRKYVVFRIMPKNYEHAAIIMYGPDGDEPPWQLYYQDSNHYFNTSGELLDYYYSRLKAPANGGPPSDKGGAQP